jgi:hypothetical protein
LINEGRPECIRHFSGRTSLHSAADRPAAEPDHHATPDRAHDYLETYGSNGIVLPDQPTRRVVNLSAGWTLPGALRNLDVHPDGRRAAVIVSEGAGRSLGD